jgi:hypothetical protein
MISQFFIEPKTITNVAEFILVEIRVTLNKTAVINYSLCTEDGIPLKHGMLELSEEQYSNWGSDDNYILNLISLQEGLTIK